MGLSCKEAEKISMETGRKPVPRRQSNVAPGKHSEGTVDGLGSRYQRFPERMPRGAARRRRIAAATPVAGRPRKRRARVREGARGDTTSTTATARRSVESATNRTAARAHRGSTPRRPGDRIPRPSTSTADLHASGRDHREGAHHCRRAGATGGAGRARRGRGGRGARPPPSRHVAQPRARFSTRIRSRRRWGPRSPDPGP